MALHREEDDRRGGADALVPAGERELDRALAARGARDGERDAGARDDLLADALRVRVDVRPAPVRGALEAGLDEAVAHVLALHGLQLGLERRADGGLAASHQVLRGALEELALAERVLAAALGLRDEVEAVGDLAVRRPEVATELLGAREGEALARHLLEDEALAVADHVAGRRVHERRVAERLRERDEVLRAERVRLERLVERRVEVDDARDVDDRVDGALDLLEERCVDAAVRLTDVAVDGDDLLLQEGFEARRRGGCAAGRGTRSWRSRSRSALRSSSSCSCGRADRCDRRSGSARASSPRRSSRETRCRRG